MWKYTSFGESEVVSKWEIDKEYFLYKLRKNSGKRIAITSS